MGHRIHIRDIDNLPPNSEVSVFGWIKAIRAYKTVWFVDIVDSTGSVQVVLPVSLLDNSDISNLHLETAIHVQGKVIFREKSKVEIQADLLEIIGSSAPISPPIRRASSAKIKGAMLRKRHLYLRNPYFMDIFRFRDHVVQLLHEWFHQNGFIEFHAPILTPVPLYSDESAIAVDFFGNKVFLTQCVGFYLEAAVHAFEKVYNIGPSFRNEKSTGKRYLAEYWHVKAEIAFASREDLMRLVESLLSSLLVKISGWRECSMVCPAPQNVIKWATIPWPRIEYSEALQILEEVGIYIEWGKNFSAAAEKALSRKFVTPFWVVGLPRTAEPFPYRLDEQDARIVKTADLILPEGYGELLGVAEKICDFSQLEARMKEKGVWDDARYEWIKELRQYGCVPHGGVGMGLERLIRWLLELDHVRDAIPFPREFRRRAYP